MFASKHLQTNTCPGVAKQRGGHGSPNWREISLDGQPPHHSPTVLGIKEIWVQRWCCLCKFNLNDMATLGRPCSKKPEQRVSLWTCSYKSCTRRMCGWRRVLLDRFWTMVLIFWCATRVLPGWHINKAFCCGCCNPSCTLSTTWSFRCALRPAMHWWLTLCASVHSKTKTSY